MKTRQKLIVTIFTLTLLFIGGLYLRVNRESCGHLEAGEALVNSGRTSDSIDLLATSAAWRAPGLGCARRAGDLLIEVLSKTEDRDLRVEGYRRLRSALISSRSLVDVTPSALLLRAEEELKKDGALESPKIVISTLKEVPFLYNLLRGALFLSWIGMAFYALWKGFRPNGEVLRKELLRYGGVASLLYLLWLFALI